MHPMVYLFYTFVFMLFIPNYIYLIPCFFTCNSIFYVFQQGVTNNDILFTALLPVSKHRVVESRFLFAVIIQLLMLLLYIPMIFINHAVNPAGNLAGVDASITLLASCLILFAVFNSVFMPEFYKTGYKAGRSFLISAIAVFVWIFLSEGVFIAAGAAAEQLSFFAWIKENLDCWAHDASSLTAQLIALGVGIIVYAAATGLSLKRSKANFDNVDL